MSLKFNCYNDYILIESLSGIDYFEIMEGIPKLLTLPEFKNKNDIWLFKSGAVNIAYSDLLKINLLANKYCPKITKNCKTAIVVRNDFQKAVCKLYAEICKGINREIRVFKDLESAKDWILELTQQQSML